MYLNSRFFNMLQWKPNPFWKQNAGSSGVMVAGWHRMGYEFEDGSLIGECNPQYILFGVGSTQLLNAAVYSLSHHTPYSLPTKVVASAPPYYPVYKSQTELLDSNKYKFSGDTSSWKNKTRSTSTTNFMEFVTCPNNPDGHFNKAVLLTIGWPHYTAIPSPMDEDLMLFTLPKLTGHAGSRFGWAIVKDKDVYDRMVEYIDLNTYGDRREMFQFAHTIMKTRWEKLAEILSTSKRFSIEQLPSQHCAFSQPPSPGS
ncbi:hypothetical protein R3W88_004663 [Solanum pinnatisectum]|uniref:Alliinase C-terminal domain-containing protein n=1 Tax=Solanum pinnatisectum TaxID=50273 RepID=A0AAV9KCC0_9SOLN|nr:hypothetical protein R3W88_004663 [Solanum pinnatisectum]